MAKTKAELLQEAKELNLDVNEKHTVKEITDAIKNEASKTEDAPAEPVQTAKAGKRSAKALREQKELEEKEARKAEDKDSEQETKKQHQNPTRTRLERRSKKYKAAAALIEKGKAYTIAEAIPLTQSTSKVSFDATVELHARLNVDPRQADQNIRDSVILPAGSGKMVRVAVFADVEHVKEAKAAGADIAMSDEFLELLEKEDISFDVLISTPDMMAKLGKYARLLGPKGLMPNPKSGTVTKDVTKAVKEAQAGKVEYRVDEAGIVHVPIGKVSFSAEELIKNARAFASSLKSNKPSTIKGAFVRSFYATTSMGPSISIDPNEV